MEKADYEENNMKNHANISPPPSAKTVKLCTLCTQNIFVHISSGSGFKKFSYQKS